MRLSVAVLVSVLASSSAFLAPHQQLRPRTAVFSSTIDEQQAATEQQQQVQVGASPTQSLIGLTAQEIKARLDSQLEKLREKDATSKQLSKEVSQ